MPQTREPTTETPASKLSESLALAAVLSEVAAALQDDPLQDDPLQEPLVEEGDPPASGASQPCLIERRCPYCHDGLGSGEQVLCSGCVTPHHAACFREHGGCSLLGCDAKRSLDLDGPASRILCSSCMELTPSNAPFCAKCGSRHEAGSWSASPVAARRRLQEFFRAAAVLLVASFAVGAGLGSFGEKERRVQLEAARDSHRMWQESALKDHLRAIQRAQVVFARDDLDGDGEGNYAQSVAELEVALDAARALAAPDAFESDADLARQDLLEGGYWRSEWEVRLTKSSEGRQVAQGRRLDEPARLVWSCDLQGRIERRPANERTDP